VPAVVLVHGSGPQDRDETIGPNKVFKDLAWGLANRGVAVLRYDKRSLVAPLGVVTVTDEVIDDAGAALGLIGSQDLVDPNKVFVLGHSLGGMLAPRIVRDHARAAGMIVLAGTARPIEDVIVEQITYLKGADSTDAVAAREFAKRVRDPQLRAGDTVEFMGSPIPADYWLDLRGYRPEVLAATLKKPLLVLQGGRDYQVTQADFELWTQAVDGRPNARMELYPSLNHLFIAGEGRSLPDEYLTPGHVDHQVIADIADWIQRN